MSAKSGLSRLQRELIRRIHADGNPFSRKNSGSRSEAPSRSRALRRLEQRGLVRRHNPNGRTIRVLLTDAGTACAQWVVDKPTLAETIERFRRERAESELRSHVITTARKPSHDIITVTKRL
ncbi:MAG: hypothetical protein WD042_05115 [Phycisphaeraceae bacterium]